MTAKFKFSQESYAKLLQNERNLTDMTAELATAEKCGIDCQRYRAVLQQQLATIAQMKANYAPTLP